MTTNKQSEKREAPIMVIEGKTLKTLIKKENKMNKSINKCVKPTKKFTSIPTYALNKNSRLSVKLPNGMDLVIYSNEKGDYCHLDISNHSKESEYEIRTEEKKKEYSNFNTRKADLEYTDSNSFMGVTFTKFNEK